MRNESSTRLKPRLSQMKHINETDNIVIFRCSRNLSTMVFKKKTHLKVLNGLGRWIVQHWIGSPSTHPSSSIFAVKIEVKLAESAPRSWPSGRRINPKIFGDASEDVKDEQLIGHLDDHWLDSRDPVDGVRSFVTNRWWHDSRRVVPTPARGVAAWVRGERPNRVEPEDTGGEGEGKEEVNTHVPAACSWSSGHSVSSGRSRCSSRRTAPRTPPQRSRWSSRSS